MVLFDDNISLPEELSLNNILPSPSLKSSKRKSKNIINFKSKQTLDPDEILEEKIDANVDNKEEKVELNQNIIENNNASTQNSNNIEHEKTRERKMSKDNNKINNKHKPLKLKEIIDREDIIIPSKLTFDIILGLLLV